MSKYWRVDTSWPLQSADDLDTDKVEKIVGRDCSDAGAGFGMRDVGFVFTDKAEAGAALKKLLDAGYTASMSDDLEDGR